MEVEHKSLDTRLIEEINKIKQGGPSREHERLESLGKLFVRKRLELLLDPGFELEDGLFARHLDGFPADAVVTVVGKINGRQVCVVAHDFTVKAGTQGAKSIEKVQRIQELSLENGIPMIYLVDSAAARLYEQFDIFLDRRHSGRMFWNQCRASGVVPQICVNLGPSPAGSAYMPAFCDLTIMVEGQSSIYLGSPRLTAKATGENVDHEGMGGAEMHCKVSGLGDVLVQNEEEAFKVVRNYLTYMPQNWKAPVPSAEARPPAPGREIEEIVPSDERTAFNMYELINRLVDENTFFEIKALFAKELITGYARMDGRTIGVVANQSRHKGGVLFPESAEKGAQFISTCNAYQIPLLFLMDISGFMISSATEQRGIIRRGAKMLMAVAEATQPRISVVVRKAFGAGYMAMSGLSYQPDCMIALPQARMAIMAPEPAVNAMYAKKLQEFESDEERERFVQEKREEFERDFSVERVASHLYLDAIVPGKELRDEITKRFEVYCSRGESKRLIERRTHIFRG